MNLHVVPQYPVLISITAFVVKHNYLFPYPFPQLVFKSFDGCVSTCQLGASSIQPKGYMKKVLHFHQEGWIHAGANMISVSASWRLCYHAEYVTVLFRPPDLYFQISYQYLNLNTFQTQLCSSVSNSVNVSPSEVSHWSQLGTIWTSALFTPNVSFLTFPWLWLPLLLPPPLTSTHSKSQLRCDLHSEFLPAPQPKSTCRPPRCFHRRSSESHILLSSVVYICLSLKLMKLFFLKGTIFTCREGRWVEIFRREQRKKNGRKNLKSKREKTYFSKEKKEISLKTY